MEFLTIMLFLVAMLLGLGRTEDASYLHGLFTATDDDEDGSYAACYPTYAANDALGMNALCNAAAVISLQCIIAALHNEDNTSYTE